MPAIVITGEEEFLRSEEAAAAIAEASDADVIRVAADFDNVDLATVLDELRMKSLFGPRKSVLIEGDKFLSANAERLAAFIKDEMPRLKDALLVISADKVPAPIVTAARKAGEVREVKRLYATDYRTGRPSASSPFANWLRQRAAAVGLKLDSAAVLSIIEASAENARSAAALLDALAAAGPHRVSVEDVEALAGGEGAALAFRLEDAVLSADLAAALALVDAAYSQGVKSFDRYTSGEGAVTAALLRALTQAVVNLAKLKEDGTQEAARGMKIFGGRYDRYLAALKRLDNRAVALLVDDAFRAEFAFKAGIMGGRELVEWLAARLTGAEVRSPESFGEVLTRD